MGCGKSGRTIKQTFREILNNHNPDRRVGDGWFMDRIMGLCWEVRIEKERFVLFEQSRWEAPNAGFWLFGEKVADPNAVRLSEAEKVHQSYAKHIVNEYQTEEMVNGVMRLKWHATNMVHFLDASVYATAAALKEGIELPSFRISKTPKKLSGPVCNFG